MAAITSGVSDEYKKRTSDHRAKAVLYSLISSEYSIRTTQPVQAAITLPNENPFKFRTDGNGSILAPRLLFEKRRVNPTNGGSMLYYSLVFLVIAIIAGILGFGVVAFAAAELARICFFVFIVLFLVSLIAPRFRGSSAP